MFAMDEAKLPPPTPASAERNSSSPKDVPGRRAIATAIVGTSSNTALTIVQLRPPNLATANVYGSRAPAPSAVGTVVSRNFSAAACLGSALMTYAGVRNNTKTDHRLQTENPMCSVKMLKIRLRRAVFEPMRSQNVGFSGSHTSIHRRRVALAGRVDTDGSCVRTASVMSWPLPWLAQMPRR